MNLPAHYKTIEKILFDELTPKQYSKYKGYIKLNSEIPQLTHNQFCILNIGGHFVALVNKHGHNYYVNSFGKPPPSWVTDQISITDYSRVVEQSPDSMHCWLFTAKNIKLLINSDI